MEAQPSTPPTQSFLYETLTPLAASSATTDQSPHSDPSEPYSVFRNQISLSTIECASSNCSAPDFFSLDVGASEVADPVPGSEPATSWNLREEEEEEEPKLEGCWFKGNSKFKSPMLQLHKEIVDFCDFLSPTPEEQASRNAAVDSVFSVIRYIWPNCQVEVFGSFRTGLYLPSSDIDVVILGSGIKTPQTGLYGLSRALSQRGIAKKIQVIGKARVPIIKFVEKTSGVAFDISFDVTSGPKAAEFIKDAVSKWPPLRPLCLILKVFLQQRELNEVYSGGIGSYALLVMLIAMLQSLRERQALQEHNLGILLVHFFDFYGRKLNTADVGVSCKGRGTFYSKSTKGFGIRGKPFLISIEDPEAMDNDIGKSSYNYFQIRSAFAMASSTLTNVKTILGLGENRSILGTIIRPDSVLLERKGGSTGEMTFDTLLPGAGKPVQLDSGDPEEILCNWQLDDEEDPLPRGIDYVEEVTPPSSGKKRKASKEKSKKSSKKIKDSAIVEREENGSRKVKSAKKRSRDTRSHHTGSSSGDLTL